MRGGHVDAISRNAISGWAADSERPDARLEIRILVNGALRGAAIAARPRRDLAVLGKYGDGAHGFSFAFPEELSADQEHEVVVCFAEDGATLPAGRRVIPADLAPPAGAAPASVAAPPVAAAPASVAAAAPEGDAAVGEMPARLRPILVTAPGRSGTTYLMACLAASRDIVVAELIPYEVRMLSYYAVAYDVLTAPADTDNSTHPDRLEGDGYHIGYNPFSGQQYAQAFANGAPLRSFYDDWVPTRLGAAMADIVAEYYRRLAADKGKDAVRFFAEKNNNLHRPTRMFVRKVFSGAREILIVRDPRDVLCSHMAYFSSTQEKAFHQLSHSCRQLRQIHDAAREDACFIRYEDMIRGDAATYDRLSAFLDADVTSSDGAAGRSMFDRHGTSESPEASIGRWRRDLTPELREQTLAEWGGFLESFGYDRT
jgi:hypothetical protein